jgi:hypothetical protein
MDLLSRSLRLGGILVTLLLAVLALMYLTGVVALDQLESNALKILGITAVLAIAMLVVGALIGKPSTSGTTLEKDKP